MFSSVFNDIIKYNKPSRSMMEDVVNEYKKIPRYMLDEYESAIMLINTWHLEVDPNAVIQEVLIRVLYCKVYYHYIMGHYEEVLRLHHISNLIDYAIEDVKYLGLINRLTANVSYSLGILDFALENAFSSLKVFKSLNNEHETIRCFNLLGMCYSLVPDYNLQISYFEEALLLAESIDDTQIMKTMLNNIGYTYIQMKDYKKAQEYLHKGLSLLDEHEESLSKVGLMINKSRLLLDEGFTEEAFIHVMEIFKIKTLYSDKTLLIELNMVSFDILVHNHNLDEALKYLDEGLKIAMGVGSSRYVSEINMKLSEYYLNHNDYKRAYEHQKVGLEYKEKIDSEKASLQYLILRIEYELDTANRELMELKFQTNILTKELVSTKSELKETQEVTIYALATLAEYRDKVTGNHILRTTHYSRLFCELLKTDELFGVFMTEEFISDFSRSSSLHDIGKVGVSDIILNKPGKLTEDEFEIMKNHTEIGMSALAITEKILGEGSFLRIAKEIAYTHHEKWDGSGYPKGLSGTGIPLTGRIMAIIDVYDALISKRPYKEPFSHKKAVDIIKSLSGTHFDPYLIKIFIDNNVKFFYIARDLFDSSEELESLISDMDDEYQGYQLRGNL